LKRENGVGREERNAAGPTRERLELIIKAANKLSDVFGCLSFDMRPVGVHVIPEDRLHPRNMPLAVRFEKVDNVLLKPQVHRLLWGRQNQPGLCPIGFQAPLVFVLGNPPFEFFIRHGVHFGQIGAAVRAFGFKLRSRIALKSGSIGE